MRIKYKINELLNFVRFSWRSTKVLRTFQIFKLYPLFSFPYGFWRQGSGINVQKMIISIIQTKAKDENPHEWNHFKSTALKKKKKLKKHSFTFTSWTVLSSSCSERLGKRAKGSVATSHGGSPQSSGSAAGKGIGVIKHPWKPPVCTGFRSSPSENRTWVGQRGAAWGNHYKGQMFVQLW